MQHSSRIRQALMPGAVSPTIRRTLLITFGLFALGLAAAIAYFGLPADDQLGSPINPAGYPGSTGWQLLDQKKDVDGVSIHVHHVFASHNGIHVVYSANAVTGSGRLSPSVVTKHVTDGTLAADSTADRLVATDDRAAVRIASIGKPAAGRTTYGMNVAGLDTNDSRASLSVDIMADETPGVVEEGISLISHPGPEAPYLLHGGYWVFGPHGTTFGILPSSVIATEETPSYFMIAPDGTIREITFDELVAFNEEHRR